MESGCVNTLLDKHSEDLLELIEFAFKCDIDPTNKYDPSSTQTDAFVLQLIKSPRHWLFVGLGNPGDKFKETRHNKSLFKLGVGWDCDGHSFPQIHIRKRLGISVVDVSGIVDGVPVLLAKPQTYMNLSGEWFHDDMDLPCGVLHLQPKGGHGTIMGMNNINFKSQNNFLIIN
ncbi:hypothetical protein LXL04_004248 [Taraxacum kok-saghyz]